MTLFNRTPGAYTVMRDNEIRVALDKDMKNIFDVHRELNGIVVRGVGSGFSMDSGELTVLGSKLRIQTALTTVERFSVTIDNGAIATNQTVTARVTPANKSQIDVFCWQPTAAGDTTPIACTTALAIKWIVTGRSA